MILKLIRPTEKYAEQVMQNLYKEAVSFVDNRVGDATMKCALTAYLDYVIQRTL